MMTFLAEAQSAVEELIRRNKKEVG